MYQKVSTTKPSWQPHNTSTVVENKTVHKFPTQKPSQVGGFEGQTSLNTETILEDGSMFFDRIMPSLQEDNPATHLKEDEVESHKSPEIDHREGLKATSVTTGEGRQVSTPPVVQPTPQVNVQRLCTECEQEKEEENNKDENLSRMGLQAKLTIGEPGDKYEQEADQVARQVVQRINAPQVAAREPIQKQPDLMAKVIQRIHESRQEEKAIPQVNNGFVLQAYREAVGDSVPEVQADFENTLNRARGGGSPLDHAFRAKVEPAMGADFSGVKVHTDSKADQLSQSIQAKAFTTGQDIFFKRGEYDPSSQGGQDLLAHELTHVVQQNGGLIKQKKSQHEADQFTSIQAKELLTHTCNLSYLSFNKELRSPLLNSEAEEPQKLQAKEFFSHILSTTTNKELQLQLEEQQLVKAKDSFHNTHTTTNEGARLQLEKEEPEFIQAKELSDLRFEAVPNKEMQLQPARQEQELLQTKEILAFTAKQNRVLKPELGWEDEQESVQAKELSGAIPDLTLNKGVQLQLEEEQEPIQAKEVSGMSPNLNREIQLKSIDTVNQIGLDRVATTGITSSSLLLQRGILSSITGLAERGLGSLTSRIIAPMRRLAATGLRMGQRMGQQIAEAYRRTEVRFWDIFSIPHLAFRFARNHRRIAFAQAIQQERETRSRAAAERGETTEATPDPAPIQLEQWNQRFETLESGIESVFEVNQEITEGAILGDFKENPTIWNTIGQIAMGFVPYAGQAADIRDLVASIIKLRNGGYRDPWEWFNLFLVVVGFIPGIGDAIKAIGRGAKGLIRQLGSGILRHGGDLWRAASRNAKSLLRGARRYGRQILERIGRVGRRLREQVRGIGRRVVNSIRSASQRVRRLVSGIRERVSRLARSVSERIRNIASRARGLLGRAIGRLVNLARRAFNTVRSTVTRGINAVRGAIQRGRAILGRIGRRIANAIQRARAFLRESIQSAIQRGRILLQQARQRVSRAIREAIQRGRQLTVRARRGARDLYRRGVDWVKNRAIAWIRQRLQSIKQRILRFLRRAYYKLTRTRPSARPNPQAAPGGGRSSIPAAADPDTRRALTRENESADALAGAGYRVEQNPRVTGPKNPDYRIEGRIFDNIAPVTRNPRNIWDRAREKVTAGQADRIVLNLDDSSVDINALRRQFNNWDIPGLREVLFN